MKNSFALKESNVSDAQGIVIPLLSGDMTGIAAGADVAAICNLGTRPLIIDAIRIRWVTKTAFASAQALAFRVNKVYGFTAVHTGGTPTAVQAHYNFQEGVKKTMAGVDVVTGDRIPLTEISSVIAGTAAITTATYTAEDTDEPEVFAVGAGSTLPGVYEPYRHPGVPIVLPQFTGLVVNNHILMGASGVGNLYVGVDAHREG